MNLYFAALIKRGRQFLMLTNLIIPRKHFSVIKTTCNKKEQNENHKSSEKFSLWIRKQLSTPTLLCKLVETCPEWLKTVKFPFVLALVQTFKAKPVLCYALC